MEVPICECFVTFFLFEIGSMVVYKSQVPLVLCAFRRKRKIKVKKLGRQRNKSDKA